MKQLLEAGVHFGHQTRRWNPAMRQFIFTERNGIHIIDLQQTVGRLAAAYDYVKNMVAEGKTVLFVGTKKQAQETMATEAARAGMPYVNQRWLGGTLTNFVTIQGRIDYLVRLEDSKQRGEFDRMTKKEQRKIDEEIERLNRYFGGIKELTKLPGALFIVDTVKEHIAVTEARRLGIPIVALIDTPGAYPGVTAEERGQAHAIARNILEMSRLRTPVVCVVISEGGSGGALGIGVGDRVLMLENAYYSVISPEGCSSILWKTAAEAPRAAEILKLTARDLLTFGVIDQVVPEPLGGAHKVPGEACRLLGEALVENLDKVAGLPLDQLLEQRYEKIRRIGMFLENGRPAGYAPLGWPESVTRMAKKLEAETVPPEGEEVEEAVVEHPEAENVESV